VDWLIFSYHYDDFSNQIPIQILACLLKDTNKKPIRIMHLFKAIPCSSNSTPLPNFLIILKPKLPGIPIRGWD
jgi:hypothetical protein